MKIIKGDIVRTPELQIRGVYQGLTKKGYAVRSRVGEKVITIFSKTRPHKIK